ncbi:putative F-box domain, FBD domain, leucine-rich repeat domain superfamily [Helianthus annuus]|nr:putative F-box domain, FBD domain, F-box-like domain superfamily protein [Helianthus annuus]KAJ0823227.1 putative F-box domain, FBD domain, leucine-rich repeat domain superfamily [Helianthus annuus]
MDYQNPTRTRSLNSDIISTLPQNIIEDILTRMPLRSALRTSVLSMKWRYTWRGMPKLVFTDDLVASNHLSRQLKKYKLVNAILHVLLFHNGPETLEFDCSVVRLHMESEFAQIISYLARGNTVKKIIFISDNRSFKLPVSFFALQGLEVVHLDTCTLEPPLTFNGASSLTRMTFRNVEVSAQVLQRFISKCSLLHYFVLVELEKGIESVPEGNNFTFVDLFQCVPLLNTFAITKHYMKVLFKLKITSDVRLWRLLNLTFVFGQSTCVQMYDNEKLPVQQTATNFLDLEGYPDMKLDHLETFWINNFSNLPLEMEFVRLIMAKSPVLKKVRILLNDNVSVDEEVKMLRELVSNPIPRASPSAKLTIVRPETS